MASDNVGMRDSGDGERSSTRREWVRGALTSAAAIISLNGKSLMAESTESDKRVGLLLDPLYKEHETGYGHPERPARYDAVTAALTDSGLAAKMAPVEPRLATEDELALCHSRPYIALVEREVKAGRRDLSTGDATMGPHSWDVSRKAAGGVMNAVDQVMRGETRQAFCAVRPPGHHARPSQGMGFCLFNNIAIGARYAQQAHGAERVLIADWDVHHGNGTQDIFYEDGSVFFFSTHQWPWYPGTGPASERGEGAGEGTTMNRPFPAGAGRKEIVGVFDSDLRAAADEFQPDLVMISAGFDSRAGDPLGGFLLTDEDFADLTRIVQEIADQHCGGRIVSVLEGGYALDGLGKSVAAHVGALVG